MKEQSKGFAIGFILMALLALGGYLWLERKHASDMEGLQTILDSKNGEVTFWKNKAGESISRASQVSSTFEQYRAAHPQEVAAILKEFSLEPSQLRNFLKASIQAKNKGVSVVKTIYSRDTVLIQGGMQIDSVRKSTFEIYDGYLALGGESEFKVGDSWSQVKWQYRYLDTLTFVGRVQKTGFLGLGKKKYFVDGSIKNPRAQITSIKNVEIREFVDKRFGIGPALVYDPFSGTLRIGVGVTYNLIRF